MPRMQEGREPSGKPGWLQPVFPPALYSASVLERDIVGCLIDIQYTGTSLTVNMTPFCDLRVSEHAAQSLSENAANVGDVSGSAGRC
jgi:hypothetical protein